MLRYSPGQRDHEVSMTAAVTVSECCFVTAVGQLLVLDNRGLLKV